MLFAKVRSFGKVRGKSEEERATNSCFIYLIALHSKGHKPPFPKGGEWDLEGSPPIRRFVILLRHCNGCERMKALKGDL